ncbi:MAG: 50S ribosomal protein L35 [Verrucomicrobiales bacterium]|jgi:large subunit ribosomal protein L35|nr:50S ribosomal protein L35 [Verrucomicrobiales bacterium]
MQKQSSAKTKKAVAKRFKLTAGGKLKRARAGKRHLAAAKNRKRKRQLSAPGLISDADIKRMKVCLPFG